MSEILTNATSKAIDLSVQPELVSSVIPHFNKPALLVGSLVVAVAGVATEAWALKNEKQVQENGVPFADPDIAKQARLKGAYTRWTERAAWYTAMVATTLAFAHAADPYTEKSELKGSGSVLIGAGYSADVKDMLSGDDQVTRLQASAEGVLSAAKEIEMPFSIALTGSTVRTVDKLPAEHKDIERSQDRIRTALTPGFRNGSGQMGAGVRESMAATEPGTTNNIIMVASDLKTEESIEIKKLQKQIEKKYPESRIKAVVVGRGEGEYRVGTETLTSSTNIGGFEDLLGADNVHAAESAEEVESAINDIVNETQTVEQKQPTDIFRNGFIASTLALIGLAGFRRNWGRLKPRG